MTASRNEPSQQESITALVAEGVAMFGCLALWLFVYCLLCPPL